MYIFLGLLLLFGLTLAQMWPKGIVHYVIDQKDYDLHSQDVITSTFAQLEREICVKFFNSPLNYTNGKVLMISNPEKIKACPPGVYNFTGNYVLMPIGYKCVTDKEIARITVDMLRASIEGTGTPVKKLDLMQKFRQEVNYDPSTLLSREDRNFINSHYFSECGELSARPFTAAVLRSGQDLLAPKVKDRLWPLGVVTYHVAEELRQTFAHKLLRVAMTTIESKSCVVFKEYDNARSVVSFRSKGDSVPLLGHKDGENQHINLFDMVVGAPGHTAHPLNNLLRLLGVPMMSNRFDRDNYVEINWKNIQKGKEHLLERDDDTTLWGDIPYDFKSATHAPANFLCDGCHLGETTVKPVQDYLWQRTLSMGHVSTLSPNDTEVLFRLYSSECTQRT